MIFALDCIYSYLWLTMANRLQMNAVNLWDWLTKIN